MLMENLNEIKRRLKNVKPETINSEALRTSLIEIKRELRRLDSYLRKAESLTEADFLSRIRKSGNDPFTLEDVETVTHKPKKEAYIILNKLIRNGMIDRIGRNFFTFGKHGEWAVVTLSEMIRGIKEILTESGISFQITGPDIVQGYVNLIPKRLIHLIYVAKGSGEWAKMEIESKKTIFCLLNPSKKEVKALFSKFEDDLVVIREVGDTSLGYSKEGVAQVEKALVDLYFETTRKKIPFDVSELANILSNILTKTRIDVIRILRMARRRNIEGEFGSILKKLGLPLRREVKLEKERDMLTTVLNLLRGD